ncbi:DsbA family oxidoreductase [bacterium]|nr:MAG: DsbA family oxidoreductase [bacterium]
MAQKLAIDVWSDIACPWCYIGKRRLEVALDRVGRDTVELRWHSFELDPTAPRESMGSHLELISKKYGASPADAQSMLDRVAGAAKGEGLDFHFDSSQPSNTFDAHRLLHFASEHGKQDALKERLFHAYFSEGARMGDKETLVRLATDVGLDAAAARAVVESEAHALDVRRDQEEAREIGIRGVPFFVFGGRLAVSGAESADVLEKALREASSMKPAVFEEGATCGPDGC